MHDSHTEKRAEKHSTGTAMARAPTHILSTSLTRLAVPGKLSGMRGSRGAEPKVGMAGYALA